MYKVLLDVNNLVAKKSYLSPPPPLPPPSLLLSMHHMPLAEEVGEGASVNSKRVLGVTADGTMWIYHLVQYAQVLLKQPKHVECSQPFSPEQRQAWDRWGRLSDRIQIIASFKDRRLYV